MYLLQARGEACKLKLGAYRLGRKAGIASSSRLYGLPMSEGVCADCGMLNHRSVQLIAHFSDSGRHVVAYTAPDHVHFQHGSRPPGRLTHPRRHKGAAKLQSALAQADQLAASPSLHHRCRVSPFPWRGKPKGPLGRGRDIDTPGRGTRQGSQFSHVRCVAETRHGGVTREWGRGLGCWKGGRGRGCGC